MKNYPPYKIFLSFVLVFLCAAIFFLIIPGDKYRIQDLIKGGINEGGFLNTGRSPRPPEISGIILHPSDEPVESLDSIFPKDQIVFPNFISAVGIEYPNGDENTLVPFIESINSISNQGGQVRILYYGDSQLEEDRITVFFRARLQSEYGGSMPQDQSKIPESGLIVDNNAQRGSAGLEFSKDTSLLNQHLTGDIYPDLIILQFGINVVPARTDNFDYYKNYLIREINYINVELPGVPLLIIGVSDMGHLMDGVPTAYPSVEKVAKAQHEAAKETGAAYYDLLKFMGGSGSFLSWMEADPVLMRRDFTHFSHAGGALVAEGIAQALIREVKNYTNKEDGI